MPTPSAAAQAASLPARPWHRQLGAYHWLVLVVCTLAWLLDCLTQQIFNLARTPAMADLLGAAPGDPRVLTLGGWGTAMLLVGWATGGIIFGVLGDRIGRVRTLVIMVLCYSVSTGICGLAQGPWQYIACCFLTGVGAGGIFPVGCTLVAESLPEGTRPQALGMLQAFSAFGNVSAGLLSLLLGHLLARGIIATQWRWMFCLGVLPSLLTVLAVRKLREPEVWKKAAAGRAGRRGGSLVEMFADPRWRRRAIVGLLLASSGVIGLWGIGVFSNDLTQTLIRREFEQRTAAGVQVAPNVQQAEVAKWAAITLIMFNVGAFFGMYAFARVTQWIGRRPAFALAFLAAGLTTSLAFLCMKSRSDIFWMTPLMGAAQLSVFGGYAIYFPELFPTRLRSTGTSFCYNVGRYVAATGPVSIAFLKEHVFVNPADPVQAFRYAGVAMCACYLVGLVALVFAPETRGKPLPE